MPLRVAEKDGCIYAVNGCGDCPFNGWDGHMITVCGHEKAKDPSMLYRDRIPVWCPLPSGEYRELKVLEPEDKLDIRLDHRHIKRGGIMPEWTDEYKAMVMKRLAQIIEWCNVMWYLPLDEAQKKFPEAEITEEKGFQGEQAVICRRYINPFGGIGFRVFYARNSTEIFRPYEISRSRFKYRTGP